MIRPRRRSSSPTASPSRRGRGATSSRPSPPPATTSSPRTSAATAAPAARPRSRRTGSTRSATTCSACVDETGHDQAVFVGHDWGALIVWDLARLHPERVRAVAGVSVPFTFWPARPTEFLRAVMGDRFFYILYFQEVGPAERELEADLRTDAVDDPVGRFRRGLRTARSAAGRRHGLPHGRVPRHRRCRGHGCRRTTSTTTSTRSRGRASSARSATTATSTPTTTGSRRCRPRA